MNCSKPAPRMARAAKVKNFVVDLIISPRRKRSCTVAPKPVFSPVVTKPRSRSSSCSSSSSSSVSSKSTSTSCSTDSSSSSSSSKCPTALPSKKPSKCVSKKPSKCVSKKPSCVPSKKPSRVPSKKPCKPQPAPYVPQCQPNPCCKYRLCPRKESVAAAACKSDQCHIRLTPMELRLMLDAVVTETACDMPRPCNKRLSQKCRAVPGCQPNNNRFWNNVFRRNSNFAKPMAPPPRMSQMCTPRPQPMPSMPQPMPSMPQPTPQPMPSMPQQTPQSMACMPRFTPQPAPFMSQRPSMAQPVQHSSGFMAQGPPMMSQRCSVGGAQPYVPAAPASICGMGQTQFGQAVGGHSNMMSQPIHQATPSAMPANATYIEPMEIEPMYSHRRSNDWTSNPFNRRRSSAMTPRRFSVGQGEAYAPWFGGAEVRNQSRPRSRKTSNISFQDYKSYVGSVHDQGVTFGDAVPFEYGAKRRPSKVSNIECVDCGGFVDETIISAVEDDPKLLAEVWGDILPAIQEEPTTQQTFTMPHSRRASNAAGVIYEIPPGTQEAMPYQIPARTSVPATRRASEPSIGEERPTMTTARTTPYTSGWMTTEENSKTAEPVLMV